MGLLFDCGYQKDFNHTIVKNKRVSEHILVICPDHYFLSVKYNFKKQLNYPCTQKHKQNQKN